MKNRATLDISSINRKKIIERSQDSMSYYVNPSPISQLVNYVYEGQDLSIVFAEEIEATTCTGLESPTSEQKSWQWIYNRIKAHNYDGIHPGDWLPMTIPGFLVHGNEHSQVHILGINTYKNSFSLHHMDFASMIGSTTTSTNVNTAWNDESTNNGTEATGNNASPFLSSTLYQNLQTCGNQINDYIKNLISTKTSCVELRPKSEEPLTESTSAVFLDIGKFWTLTEYEIFGQTVMGTPRWSSVGQKQYPMFQQNGFNLYSFSLAQPLYTPTSYVVWTATPVYGSDTDIVVSYSRPSSLSNQIPYTDNCTNKALLNLCFRISA